MTDPRGYCVVLTTTDSETAAEELATKVIDARLAACVQIQEIRSFYRWEEKTTKATELLLSIKTRKALYDDLERFIREHHGYQTPEIIQLDVTAGSSDYLDWIDQETGRSDRPA